MSKRIFTQEQLKQLTDNKNTSKCSERSISYSKDFKIKAVQQYIEQGLSPREIFKQAGFDLGVIGKQKADDCLLRWKKTYRIKGQGGLSKETRGKGRGGGRPKTKYQTDKAQIKYLEAQVAYLKAENDFLAKLRASKKR
jgi:transposase-like protein